MLIIVHIHDVDNTSSNRNEGGGNLIHDCKSLLDHEEEEEEEVKKKIVVGKTLCCFVASSPSGGKINQPTIAAGMTRSFYHLLLTGMPFNSISTGGIGTPCRMFNIVVLHCIGGTASLIATAQVKKHPS